MKFLRRPIRESSETRVAIQNLDELMSHFGAKSLADLALELERITGVEERIDLTRNDGQLQYELGGVVFEIPFPTSVEELVGQISASEDDAYDTVSPRGYEDFDLLDE